MGSAPKCLALPGLASSWPFQVAHLMLVLPISPKKGAEAPLMPQWRWRVS
jgi:hypothetical protein